MKKLEGRYIERLSSGTVDITEGGWLRVYNGSGIELAAIKPTKEQWGMIAAKAVERMRFA